MFRGAEFARLLTLVAMLAVMAMLIYRARDPGMWKWIAPGAGEEKAEAEPDVSLYADTPPAAGPTDLDREELDAAREAFQAITDKSALGKEEMAAYWRLMGWSVHQSIPELRKRAETEVRFRQFFQDTSELRGKLVQIPVHVRRALRVENVAENPLDLKNVYEVFGWTTDSQPYWYWLIVPELPPGMPQGDDLYEEATFVGYFLKLLSYEDRQGKVTAAPLLIGRLVWHPSAENPLARQDEWQWTWYLAGALAVLFALRWGLFAWGRRPRAAEPIAEPHDEKNVDTWLDNPAPTAPTPPEVPDERPPWES